MTFTFKGSAVSWIGLKCNICGIASVSIDGAAETAIDTAGAAAPGSDELTSEPVFSASGLTDDVHALVITVTGTTSTGGAHVIVDAFDVGGSGILAASDGGGGGGSADAVWVVLLVTVLLAKGRSWGVSCRTRRSIDRPGKSASYS